MRTRLPILLLTALVTGCATHSRAPTSSPAARAQVPVATPAPLFLLDGEEIRPGDATMIDSASIAAVDVLKGSAATALYGLRAAARVVSILTRTSPVQRGSATPLYLLDGREIPGQLARVLDARKLGSVEVLKGPAARAYGARAEAGVVLISSKGR